MFILLGLLSAMVMEYFLHRIYLHNPSHAHITEHHKIFHKNYENPAYGYKDIVSKPAYVFVSSIFALLITIILSFSFDNAYIIYTSAVLYLLWVEWVHYLFHSPKGSYIEKLTLFQSLKEHHHIHHLEFKINYGIGSSLMDYIFRTKK